MVEQNSQKETAGVGIDIGSHSIKVAVVSGTKEKPFLESFNIRNIGYSLQKIDLASEVGAAFSEVGIAPQNVNLSIYGPDVIVRFITLPEMTKEQLDAALVYEAEKYIPFNVREVVLDSVILGETQEKGQMKVLLAAAKKEPVEKIVKVFADMDIPVNFIDINAFAVFNAFTRALPGETDKVSALLDVGHSQTCLLISVAGVPLFMRQINIGGRNIDELIARSLSVEPEKAAEFKIGIGDFDRQTVKNCTRKIFDDIVREIQLSFGYFEGTCGRSIEGIFCSGGLLYADGFLPYLSERTGTDIKKWDPLAGFKFSDTYYKEDLDSVSSTLAVSVGLAVRS